MALIPKTSGPQSDLARLVSDIKRWSRELGFQQTGITDTDLSAAETALLSWLKAGYHGDMEWMARHGSRRTQPAELVPGTLRIVSVRMDYLPPTRISAEQRATQSDLANISCYALGRDYHKLMRKRLQQLASRIQEVVGPFGYRVFVDSAPVMERALAEKAGLGWIGKHTNLIDKNSGSWFFLGELYTDLPLPTDTTAENHCGTCSACIDICPTRAIVAPYKLDARRCISYLTIEHAGPIPKELRPLMGNHIYGCDDCQLVCPWNRYARVTTEEDFFPRENLDAASLLELFAWDEVTFLNRTEGSAIRRIGHERWLRNIAVALGNTDYQASILAVLQNRRSQVTPLVREHIDWALENLESRVKKD